MTVGAVAGTKLYIAPPGTLPLSPDLWVLISKVANIGAIGNTFNKIAVESIDDGYTRQIKGTEMAPAFPLVMNRDDDDAGQGDVVDAAANRNDLYNFKLVENDGDGVSEATATVITFKGRVYGAPRNYGGVNDLKQISTEIEIEPDSIVFTAAP